MVFCLILLLRRKLLGDWVMRRERYVVAVLDLYEYCSRLLFSFFFFSMLHSFRRGSMQLGSLRWLLRLKRPEFIGRKETLG